MKAYVSVQASLLQMQSGGQNLATAALRPVLTGYQAKWDPENVWTLYRREKSQVPAKNTDPNFSLVQTVAWSGWEKGVRLHSL